MDDDKAASSGPSTFDQFKQMDANKQKMDADLERRRQIYKNVRRDIEVDEKREKQAALDRKMTQLESRVAEKEEERKKAEVIARQEREAVAESR